jgi:ABC-type multidrug transport system ATPase subunit
MSESILKALMQLFAIITRVDSGNVIGRNIVEAFLKQQLTQELVHQYLKVFDDFIESIHNLKDESSARKKLSTNSVKVLRICTQINQELTQAQKIVVVIRLVEYIKANGEISEQDREFVDTVASTFNIEQKEYVDLYTFINSNQLSPVHSPNLLVIDNRGNAMVEPGHHLLSETMHGQIRVLFIDSVNMYVFKYFGHMDLYLNGQPITSDRVHLFTQGSSVRSAKLQPIYYSDLTSSFLSRSDAGKILFQVKGLEFRFKSGKIGLHHLDLQEDSGTLIGIMGGSGAGKSTVLNILNGNDHPFAGEVLINGVNIHTEKKKIEGVIGMVPQDDLLIEALTVYQNLFYAAKLCFGNWTDEEISKSVYSLLASLGLSETADLKVGSPLEKTISGGQRKRLNIGLELIREPSVLFVDEPTSGLSSRDSENIMDLLKELTLKGKLVFVVIHQPSSDIFKMFDRLLILDLGGYAIYYGNPVDAVMYFKQQINHANANESECITCGNVNPEQIFNIIESKVLDDFGNITPNRKTSPKEWNEIYREKLPAKLTETVVSEIPPSTFKIPNKWKQFKVFMTRDVLSKLTDSQYMIINFFETPVLAFILSFLVKYYNTELANTIGYKYSENENIPAYLLMAVIIALFVGLTVSAEEIIRDRKILKRESFLNLSRGSYLYSKISIMFLISAIQTFTFVVIGNNILEVDSMFNEYWFMLFTTSCFANMLGLNISASFNSAVTIYILIPFLIIPQLLLSGVIVKFDKINPLLTNQAKVPIAGELMASRWAYEALAVTQFRDNEYEKLFYEYDRVMSIANYKKDLWVTELQNKVNLAETLLQKNGDKKELEYHLLVLKREIKKEMESKSATFYKFTSIENLEPEKLTQNTIEELREYIANLTNYYIKLWRQCNEKKDKVVNEMNQTPELIDKYLALQRNYSNQNLYNLLTNRDVNPRILEYDGALVQKIDPIFMDPDKEGFVRAHFFAPRKAFMGNYYDTYWVNAIVIWLMTLIMGLTLYFDVLKKVLDGLESALKVISKKRG